MMSTIRTTLVTLVMLATASIPAGPALAQTSDVLKQQARLHFQRGVNLYTDNDYRGALMEFKRAQKLAPNPQLLYNIGQTHYQLQEYAAALRALEQYLATAGPTAEFRKMAEEALESVKGRVGTIAVTASADGAEIFIDDESAGVSPLPASVTVSMGRRRVSATLGGRTVVRTVEVGGGDALKVHLELPSEKLASSAAASPTDRGSARRAWTWASWGGFGALGVAAITTGAMSLKASSDLQKKRDTLGTTRPELESAATRSKNLALATDILLAATAVTGGVALYLTLTLPKREKPSEQRTTQSAGARVELLPGGVRVQGNF